MIGPYEYTKTAYYNGSLASSESITCALLFLRAKNSPNNKKGSALQYKAKINLMTNSKYRAVFFIATDFDNFQAAGV